MIKGLPKRGCLRVSTALVGSDFVRPGLTFIHVPTMLFHMEHGRCEEPVNVRSVGTFAVYRELGLVGSMSHQLFPWFPVGGETSNQELS